ncbi:MAG: LamB/YcsF family protein [Phycisphaerales bacterium]
MDPASQEPSGLLGPAIDLNADVGERDDLLESDLELLTVVSSVNIACGGHAGSETLMRAMLTRGADRGVGLGAHPGYADAEGCGRGERGFDGGVIYALCREQVRRLARLAAQQGLTLAHAKPHGALYHRAMGDADAAEAVARGCLDAVAEVTGDPFARLTFVGLPETPGLDRWLELDLDVAREGFIDRGYTADGGLIPRGELGAVFTDPAEVVAQAMALSRSGRFDTLCVHGDTAGAFGLARSVREALLEAGVRVGGSG